MAQAPSPVPPTTQAKPTKSQYRRNLPHLQVEDRQVFITFRTFKNFILPESVRDLVLHHCLHDHGVKFWMHAAVVMPDHVHLLFTPLRDERGNPFGLAEIMHGIKGASAHRVNQALQRHGPIWQDESFDHVLRSAENRRSKAEYICQNPERRGLALSMDDYPWLWREWVEGSTAEGGCATLDIPY